MPTIKKTLVLGASENPARYSNMAILKLRSYGHPVEAIGRTEGHLADVTIHSNQLPFKNIDTITLYLSEAHQEAYYDYILSLHPKRIIFNPGAENTALKQMARAEGIETLDACTLVMLGTGQY